MRTEDMVLISVDDHVVEPPSMTEFFKDRVPAKFRGRVPRVIRRDDGSDAWGSDPSSFDQVRPGTYNLKERIRDMDANGVLASICFPSWPGLGGQFFVASDDREYTAAMIRTYNDWHIEEWCGTYPGRFIP